MVVSTKRRSRLGTLALVVIGGLSPGACSPTRFAHPPLSPEELTQLRADIEGQRVAVQFQPAVKTRLGWSRSETGVAHLGPGALTVDASYEVLQVPLVNVDRIDVKNPGAGVGRGILAGALLGVVLGAVLGATLDPRDCKGVDSFPLGDCKGAGPIGGGIVGAGLGVLGGAIAGAVVGAGPTWDFRAPGSP